MYKNNGLEFEDEFLNEINGKRFDQITPCVANFLNSIFNCAMDSNPFIAEKCEPLGKPDVKITHNGEVHYVSLKTGSATNVHSETLVKFVEKLENMHMPSDVIETVRRFHYGDGTLDGTGSERMTFDELYPILLSKIKIANDYLNDSNLMMVEFVDKIVFRGNDETLPPADYLYHGTLSYGVFCSRSQVIRHLKRKNYDFMRNLHIGPIQFHPYARYATGVGKHEYKRDIVNFKWINLAGDIEYISNHYKL